MMRCLYCGGTTGRSISTAEASEVRAAAAPAVSGRTEFISDQDFHLKRRKLCLSSSVVVVCAAAAGSRVLPARRSAEVLRDTTIRESDAGQRHRHLPHRHGTPHQLSEFSHQGAANTLRLVESSHTFEIHFIEKILTMRQNSPNQSTFVLGRHGCDFGEVRILNIRRHTLALCGTDRPLNYLPAAQREEKSNKQ